MQGGRAIGVDDEVVRDALEAKIAVELKRRIDVTGRGRGDLDNDHRVRHLDGVRRKLRPAIDEGIGLVGRLVRHAHGRAVRQHVAGKAGGADAALQGGLDSEFHLRMPNPLGRHQIRHAVVQLPAPLLGLGPDEELVHRHLALRRTAHERQDTIVARPAAKVPPDLTRPRGGPGRRRRVRGCGCRGRE